MVGQTHGLNGLTGFYARHVNGLALDGATVRWGESLPEFLLRGGNEAREWSCHDQHHRHRQTLLQTEVAIPFRSDLLWKLRLSARSRLGILTAFSRRPFPSSRFGAGGKVRFGVPCLGGSRMGDLRDTNLRAFGWTFTGPTLRTALSQRSLYQQGRRSPLSSPKSICSFVSVLSGVRGSFSSASCPCSRMRGPRYRR